MTFTIGLDIGKADHGVFARDTDGVEIGLDPVKAVVNKAKVGNDQRSLDVLFTWFAGLAGDAGWVLAIDQIGSYARLVIAAAASHGARVAYVPGLVAHRAAELFPGQAKTDQRDAQVLCDVARAFSDQLRWVNPTDDELVAELAVLGGYDQDLRADINRLINRIRDALSSIHPPLETVLGPKLAGKAGIRALLTKYPTPELIRTAGRSRVEKLLVKHHQARTAASLTTQIFDALDAQTLVLSGTSAYGRVIAEEAVTLARLYTQRHRLEGEIEEAFRRHPFAPILLSMTGVGVKIATTILVEIGDIADFETAGHLASYAGLAPVTRQSGSSLKSETRSRRGNRRLKDALFLAAFCSIRSGGEDAAYYDKKRAEGKRHNAAVICLANRKIRALFHMLTEGRTYQTPAERNSSRIIEDLSEAA
ncbi:MAG TPA: IS110 family transposase [Microthrixaceae bacterium]|nr:IS110 family transposase [Microthrixaceae bacterium]